MSKLHDDFRTVCAKRDQRYFRQRVDLHDMALIVGINIAGHAMGVRCRADAGQAMREYIERKKCAIAATFPPIMTVTGGYVVYRNRNVEAR
jgi:hypothetical protein